MIPILFTMTSYVFLSEPSTAEPTNFVEDEEGVYSELE